MITIHNLELKRIYLNGDYRQTKFATTAEIKIGSGYGARATITLTDEQTAAAVDFILGMIRTGLTVEMEVPEPIVEDLPAPEPLVVDASEMEPL